MSLTKVSYSMITGASVNIIDFGADPTGVVDSTTAVQNAINSGKHNVYVPAGTYKISGELDLPEATFLYGDGWNSVLNYVGTGTCINIAHISVTVQDLTITTPYESGSASGGQIGVQFSTYSVYGTLNRVQIRNFYAAGIYMVDTPFPLNAYGPFHIVVNDCLVAACYTSGLHLHGENNLNDIFIFNSGFESNGGGGNTNVLIDGSAPLNIVIENCIIESGATYQIKIMGGDQIKIKNCYFETSSYDGYQQIWFAGSGVSKDITIEGCVLGVYSVQAPIIIDPTYTIHGFQATQNLWGAQGYAFISTPNNEPAQITNAFIANNYDSLNTLSAQRPQIRNIATAGYGPLAQPTSVSVGWLKMGRLHAYTTSTQAAFLIQDTGADDQFANSLAWYKWDNAIYYVGISYDEIHDGMSFNTNYPSLASAAFIKRANGYFGLGTTNPGYQLTLSTDSAAKPSTNTWTVSSDERLKDNIAIADLDRCYEIVKTIPLKRYTWKDSTYNEQQVSDRSKLGWIAQDVKTVFPKGVNSGLFSLQTKKTVTEEYEEQDYTSEIVENTIKEIKVINGVPTQVTKTVQEEVKNLLWDMVDVVDEQGNLVVEDGVQLKHQIPRMVKKTRQVEVNDTIDDCLDLNADQIYAAMYGAVQKLQEKVENIEQVLQTKV